MGVPGLSGRERAERVGRKALKSIPFRRCVLQERQPSETVRGNPFLPGLSFSPGWECLAGAGPASGSVSAADPKDPEPTSGSSATPALGGGT